MIFESHAHYDDEQFDEDREELLDSLAANGIGRVVNVGSTFAGCVKSRALALKYPWIYAALGIHPSESDDFTEENFAWIAEHADDEKTAAIGEIGLDYYWEKDPGAQKLQQEWFVRQLDLAREKNLPVVIHSRDAAEDTLRIMKEHAKGIPGVIHCYSYSKEMAREYIKMGYCIGVGGVVTYKNSRKLKETVQEVPPERILLETDCPYLAPVPHRGKRNSSLNLPYVVAEIAKLRGISEEEVMQVTWENACRLFGV